MALPKYARKVPGKVNTYEIDPDILYPLVFKQLEVAKPTRYHLEVAMGCMKAEMDTAAQTLPNHDRSKVMRLFVRGDGGRKERWGVEHHKVGEVDWRKLSIRQRAQHIAEAQKLRAVSAAAE